MYTLCSPTSLRATLLSDVRGGDGVSHLLSRKIVAPVPADCAGPSRSAVTLNGLRTGL
jgi:hypothetical protein